MQAVRGSVLFLYISLSFRAHYLQEVSDMSPKELQYIEDALGHEQFLKSQCQQAASQLTDPELKNCVNQMLAKHNELFSRFYNLV